MWGPMGQIAHALICAINQNERIHLMADQVEASHILIMHIDSERSSATRTKDEALTLIGEIKTELDGGGDFAALATTHSDCPSSNDGGSLGSFGPGAMVPEFDEAVFSLETGASSDIVETAFGYHLIHRTG
jgi:peptidyl-prolyl cis-trans isomerase C